MAEENKTEEPEPKKKSKKLLFIILGGLLLGGGGGATFFLTKGDAPPDPAATIESAAAETKTQTAALIPLDTFLVNLNDPQGERFMKVTMRLTVTPESLADSIRDDDLQLARIRDRVLTVLMAKTFEDLSDPLGKESLRFEIQGQVDTLLAGGSVQDVFFSEFVVQ